ncbi:MAG: DUF1624 domain-containing protein [Eubacterium sp.]|nr:DUF1624 domain-containing protein [Eubacterium sp.]
MKNNRERIILLDELRGFAILAMIVHHSFLDIGSLLGLEWGLEIFTRLFVLQPLFWGIFIITSGICSRLSRNCIRRGFIVLGAGLGITLVTAVIMPLMNMGGNEIYFGILHCLGTCMIITGLLMPLIKKINPVAGMIISVILFTVTYSVGAHSLLFGLIPLPEALYRTNLTAPLGFYTQSFFSADYFALLPWLFMFLFGAFLGAYAAEGRFPKFTYNSHIKAFAFVGRNSLWFYLAHQPVIYAAVYAVYLIFFKK